MSYSIIIPTFNREHILKKHVGNAIRELKEFDIEIIIINDNKNKPLDRSLFPEYSKLFIYDNPKQGVAAARNLGAMKAKNDWLIFLDDDMQIFKRNIISFNKYCNLKEKTCVNIEWVYPPELTNILDKSSFGRFLVKHGFTSMRGWNNFPDWQKNNSIIVNSIASANLMINKKLFLETGGYDENFPYAGFEDYVFSENLKKNNFKLIVDTTSLMYHNEEDRININEWFKRKKRGSITRKIAVNMGFHELKINYCTIKKIFYRLMIIFKPILMLGLKVIPNNKIFDFIYFKTINVLIGTTIYEGYNSKESSLTLPKIT